ncbi:cytochrome P450 [Kibdelosporangium persicum]|uniref:cytochrome P450 n=1 Tax=Kibdelosporangium persicum TaxID=2698649 RepID=UPI0015644972|nr:cytochrome P450 [Kibdelosporangium persicum]
MYLDHRRLANKSPEATDPGEALSLLGDAEKRMYNELLEFELGYVSRKDGGDHIRIRSAAQPAFAPRCIAELEATVGELTDELLDELSRQESPDLMELAHRLPLLVITAMLGAPRKDAERLKRWCDDINGRRRRMPARPELVQRAKQGLAKYRQYVSEIIEHGESEPRTGLVATLLAAEGRGQLTRDELVATYALVLHAGHLTTANLIGNGVLALLKHRNQWRLLRDDLSLAPGAVEETFRYDAPVQLSLRTAAVDLELSAVEIPAGTPVALLIGAANRDPKVFSRPDDVDITRRGNDHLALGHGVHFCLGGPLARLQGQVVFSTLARRFPGTKLAADPDTLPRSTGASMRGVMSLPVKFGA